MKQLVFFSLPALILGLAGCSMVSKLPVVGDGDDGGARDVKAPADAAPYTSDRPLGAGDVLDIAVFKGIRTEHFLVTHAVDQCRPHITLGINRRNHPLGTKTGFKTHLEISELVIGRQSRMSFRSTLGLDHLNRR